MRSAFLRAAICAGLMTPAMMAAPPRAESKVDQRLADMLRRTAGAGFRIRATEHFAIAYDTSYDALRPLVGRIEGVQGAVEKFCRGLGLHFTLPAVRLPIVFFNNHADFKRYETQAGFAGGSTAGFYSPETNVAAFSNTLNRDEMKQIGATMDQLDRQIRSLSSRGRRGARAGRRRSKLQSQIAKLSAQRSAMADRYNRLVILHEAAHQLLFNMGIHVRGAVNPVWLVEGLACQFEVAQPSVDRGLRRVNHLRLADLRDALGAAPRENKLDEARFEDAIASGRVVPLRRFVSEPALFTVASDDATFRYAQAWGLVFYLQKKHRDAFAAYLARLAARAPGRRIDKERELHDFEAAFGPANDSMERDWLSHTLRLRLDPKAAGR